MVITWKTRNIPSLFPLKNKNSIKETVLVVHITLMKPNVMRKLDGVNIMIQLRVQKHQNTFEATSTTILHRRSFQMLQKILRPGRTSEASYIVLWKPDPNKQNDFERLVLFRTGIT